VVVVPPVLQEGQYPVAGALGSGVESTIPVRRMDDSHIGLHAGFRKCRKDACAAFRSRHETSHRGNGTQLGQKIVRETFLHAHLVPSTPPTLLATCVTYLTWQRHQTRRRDRG
jgi:hypothetical protein